MLPFADNFLAGSLLSLLLPVGLLIALVVWLGRTITRLPGDPGTTAAPPPSVSRLSTTPPGPRSTPGAAALDRRRSRHRGRRPEPQAACPWIALGLCGAIVIGVGAGAGLHRLRATTACWPRDGPPPGCTARRRGRRGRIRRPRSRRCATRAAACSRLARCTAAPSRWRSLTPTATRPARWRGGRWPRRSARCRARSARCWSSSASTRVTPPRARARRSASGGWPAVAPWHWLRGRPRRARAGLARLPHLRRAAARRRHLAHRGPVPDRPPRRRALGLPVPVRAAVRDARPEDACDRAGGVADGRLGHRRRAHRPAATRPDRRGRGRGVARLRDLDQAADHVAAGADRRLRDDRRGRRRPGARAAGRAGGRRRRCHAAARARSTTCSTATSTA